MSKLITDGNAKSICEYHVQVEAIITVLGLLNAPPLGIIPTNLRDSQEALDRFVDNLAKIEVMLYHI
jgi:hypothetical protein